MWQSSSKPRPFIARRLLGPTTVFLLYAAGAYARMIGIGWDSFAWLHADERHMAFVVTGAISRFHAANMHVLDIFAHWFETGSSIIDPRSNVAFYVYGDVPQALVIFEGLMLSRSSWDQIIELGRATSIVFDAFTILVVSVGAYGLGGWPAAVLGALLYSSVPLALQQSNFFTVDSSLAFFSTLFVLALVRLAQSGSYWFAALAGFFMGMALACKLSAVALVPSVLFALIVCWYQKRESVKVLMASAFPILAVAALTFRLANPSAFEGPGFLGIAPSERFLANLAELARFSGPNPVPFMLQWTLPFVNFKAVRDLFLFAFGPALVLFAIWGGWRGLVHSQSRVRAGAFILVGTIAVVVAQPLIFGQPLLRYFLPAAPLLAILGGLAVAGDGVKPAAAAIAAGLCIASLGWAHAMVHSHVTQHPRIAASAWIWRVIPPGAQIANETGWDESLPIDARRSTAGPARNAGETYRIYDLDIMTPDDPQKLDRLVDGIERADILVLTSDRQYAPIAHLEHRFPLTSRYYRKLFSGELCLELAARFVKPFVLFGVPIEDTWTQESWRIFDRPPVHIFKKSKCFNEQSFRQSLLRSD